MSIRQYILFPILLFLPAVSLAAVRINEIAWMGTAISANDEWIELYNDGPEEISLEGWRVSASDGSPDIALEGTISAGAYFLLERSNEDSVPEETADIIYTGALSNAGEVLQLIDAGGARVDSVDGTGNWQGIGGDNSTKETAQRVGSSWQTAVATPKATNSTADSSSDEEESAVEITNIEISSSQSSTPSAPLVAPKIGAKIEGPSVVLASADAQFSGIVFNEDGVLPDTARFLWSFGDGGRAEGTHVIHRFQYPGEYVVILNTSYGKLTGSDRFDVSVIPAEVEISQVEIGLGGFIELENRSEHELNLSWWRLRAPDMRGKQKEFILPENTIVKERSKVRFPSTITNIVVSDKNQTVLLYPNGVLVARYNELLSPQITAIESTQTSVMRDLPEEKVVSESGSRVEEQLQHIPEVVPEENIAAVPLPSEEHSNVFIWLLALLVVVGIASLAALYARRDSSVEIEILEDE